MRACRQALGARCVPDNHDLDASVPATLKPIYDTMKSLGPEIEFQTYHETPANFLGTIQEGVSLGATSIELYQDYPGFSVVADAKLRRWARLLQKNHAP